MDLMQLHLLMMAVVDDYAHGNVHEENVVRSIAATTPTIVLMNSDSTPSVVSD